MSAASASPGKVCVVCHSDVTNLERVKDPQGHYYCKPCYVGARQKAAAERAVPTPAPAARRPAPAATPAARPAVKSAKPAKRAAVLLDGLPVAKPVEDDLPSLDDLNDMDFGASSGPTCPSCAGPMPSEAILCTGCGYNRTTGGRISTGVGVPPPVKVVKSRSGPGVGAAAGARFADMAYQPWFFGAAACAIFLLLFFSAKANSAMVGPFILITSGFELAIFIWLVVVAFQDSAVHGILTLFTCGLYGLYYCYFGQDNAHLKWGYTARIFSTLLCYALIGSIGLTALKDGSYGLEGEDESSMQSSPGEPEPDDSEDDEAAVDATMTDEPSDGEDASADGEASDEATTESEKPKSKAADKTKDPRGPRGAGRKKP
jgi:hypothetical protein